MVDYRNFSHRFNYLYALKQPSESLHQIQALVANNDVKGLITNANANDHLYKLAIEYAIVNDKHAFIEAAIQSAEMMPFLNQDLLSSYAEELNDPKFATRLLVAQINYPAEFARNKNYQYEIQYQIRIFFENTRSNSMTTEEAQKSSEFIKTIFNHSQITNHANLGKYLFDYVAEFVKNYEAASDNKTKQNILDHFLKNLPNDLEKMSYAIVPLLNTPSTMPIIEELLMRFKDTGHIILSRLDEYVINIDKQQLALVLKSIDKNNNQYSLYELIQQFLNLDANASKAEFMITHQLLLPPSTISIARAKHLIDSCNAQEFDTLLKYAITHANFIHPHLLHDRLPHASHETLIAYLSTEHASIPDAMMSRLIDTNRPQVGEYLHAILSRNDYQMNANWIIHYLNTLFENGNKSGVDALLQHEKVLKIFTNFDVVRSENRYAAEEHNKVFPDVVAWYLAHHAQFPNVFATVFKLIPETDQRRALMHAIPSFIDPLMPPLRAFIIRNGQGHVLGNLNPRYQDKTNSVRYLPAIFSQPKVQDSLTRAQSRYRSYYAHKKGGRFETISPSTQHAKMAAENCGITTLQFQHQLNIEKFPAILRDGRIKSRIHLMTDATEAVESKGLTVPEVGLDMPRGHFTFYTRVAQEVGANRIISQMKLNEQSQQARMVLDGESIFSHHPNIQFIIMNYYPFFDNKKIELPDKTILNSQIDSKAYEMRFRVNFNKHKGDVLKSIHEMMFELLFILYIEPLPPATREMMISKLTNPQSDADRQLIKALLDFLPLEFMIPGSMPLHLDYVDLIQKGNTPFSFTEIRELVRSADEAQILKALQNSDVLQFPFVVTDLLKIAKQRHHSTVVAFLDPLKTVMTPTIRVEYYPNIVYQIESLAQLILEDFDTDRVYANYTPDKITITSLLLSTNRGGAYHAEMAKLKYALGDRTHADKNAVHSQTTDVLDIPFGGDTPFPKLEAIRDSLLTYEMTTLLTCQQNDNYYRENQGKFHPVTGKGATNGAIALKKHRLFIADVPYSVQVHADDQQIHIQTDAPASIDFIYSALQSTLKLTADQLTKTANGVSIKLDPQKMIALLRRQAICYDGINVITADGKILLAHRKNRGLATAGGHHSDKYSIQGIAYGLKSEFGLVLKDPKNFEQAVHYLPNAEALEKTGIYVISGDDVEATQEAKDYALTHQLPFAFVADTDEFVNDSERLFTLTEMRGQQFYDVMPLADLSNYQVTFLKQALDQLDEPYSVQMNQQVDLVAQNNMTVKVPGPEFGRITLSLSQNLAEQFEPMFEHIGIVARKDSGNTVEYHLDVSPLVLAQQIKAHQNLPSNQL